MFARLLCISIVFQHVFQLLFASPSIYAPFGPTFGYVYCAAQVKSAELLLGLGFSYVALVTHKEETWAYIY